MDCSNFWRFISNFIVQLLIAMLLLLISDTQARGRPISLYNQPGNFHRGPGDIANLWPDFGFRIGGLQQLIARNAIKPDSASRWTRYANDRGQYIIPYLISGKFDTGEHATIARAMQAIADNTCIKFERRGGEADYVDLRNERGEGCYTVVGRSPGRNTVMLETNDIATCLEFDIVIHELMHTIGLWHEQMRYDRDDHIKIHYENIAPAYINQFEKVPDTDSTTYGVRYDYQSVMHYAKDAFASAPGKITMETLDKQFQEVIGRVKDASPGDYLKICNIYACRTCMGKPFTTRPPATANTTVGPQPTITLPTRGTTDAPTAGPPDAGATKGSGTTATPSVHLEEDRVRPTPPLPIILPLINNGWWWKNTPAPPLARAQARRELTAGASASTKMAPHALQRDCREASFCTLFFASNHHYHNDDNFELHTQYNTSQKAQLQYNVSQLTQRNHADEDAHDDEQYTQHNISQMTQHNHGDTRNDSDKYSQHHTSQITRRNHGENVNDGEKYTQYNASQKSRGNHAEDAHDDEQYNASEKSQRNHGEVANNREPYKQYNIVVTKKTHQTDATQPGNDGEQYTQHNRNQKLPKVCELALVRRHCCRCNVTDIN